MKCLPISPPVSGTTGGKKNPVVTEGGGGVCFQKQGVQRTLGNPRDPLPLKRAREIPAADFGEAGTWGPHQAHRGRDGQPPEARARKAAAQTCSRHPPVGPPATKSKEWGLASRDTRAPDRCGKFISPTGEGRGKAAGPGRERCKQQGDLGESPLRHKRAASPISPPPPEVCRRIPPLEAALVLGALTPIRSQAGAVRSYRR